MEFFKPWDKKQVEKAFEAIGAELSTIKATGLPTEVAHLETFRIRVETIAHKAKLVSAMLHTAIRARRADARARGDDFDVLVWGGDSIEPLDYCEPDEATDHASWKNSNGAWQSAVEPPAPPKPPLPVVYTAEDAGCYADGANGHDHVRRKLADLILTNGPPTPWSADLHKRIADLWTELHREMSDDASEEDEAIELLNEVTNDTAVWMMHDGDLLLVERCTRCDTPKTECECDIPADGPGVGRNEFPEGSGG